MLGKALRKRDYFLPARCFVFFEVLDLQGFDRRPPRKCHQL
jgi:hypothetical protein